MGRGSPRFASVASHLNGHCREEDVEAHVPPRVRVHHVGRLPDHRNIGPQERSEALDGEHVDGNRRKKLRALGLRDAQEEE